MFVRNTAAGVDHLDPQGIVTVGGLYLDCAAGGRMSERVLDQIAQCALEETAIEQGVEIGRRRRRERDARFSAARLIELPYGREFVSHVQQLARDRECR